MAKKPATYIQLDDRALNVFTDGSSLPKPRRGGWAYRLVDVNDDGHEVVHDYPGPGHLGATNNEMEITAVIEALRHLASRHCEVDLASKSKVVVYTDSNLVVTGVSAARYQWQSNGWMTRDGNPVRHAELWKDLLKAIDKVGKRVDIVWAKGHSKTNPHNKAVDKLAKQSANSAFRDPIADVKVRRKVSENREVRESVALHGQLMTIRIITDGFLRTQRLHEYKYEVMAGPNEGLVDRIFSEHQMSAGHTYRVRVNDNSRQPRVVKVTSEVIKEG